MHDVTASVQLKSGGQGRDRTADLRFSGGVVAYTNVFQLVKVG